MEIYIAPPTETPTAALSRQQILAALAESGVAIANQIERPGVDSFPARWSLSFIGSDATLECHERDGGLIFATLEQSMFDTSSVPDHVCRALEHLGWVVDQENVG
jgi:hypothetical protein